MTLQNPDRFFLTRQSANIMEELLRRLTQAGSISLLHGVKGIGKSRLLLQFCENKLIAKDFTLVRFNTNNCYQFILEGDAEFTAVTFFTRVIARLNNNSTVVIDQFENMPAQLQQTLLKFWSNDAFDKGLRLVVSTQPNKLANLIESSKRYHLQIDCVQLKPLNDDEQLEYLRVNCCNELRHVAVIPAELKKNLKLTNGLFSNLEAFKSQYGSDILCQDTSLSHRISFNKKLLYGFTGLLIIALTAIIVLPNTIDTEPVQLLAPAVDKNNSANHKKMSLPDNLINPVDSDMPEITVSQTADTSSTMMITAVELIEPESSSPAQVMEYKEEVPLVKADVAVISADYQQSQAFFDQRLQATKRWLSSAGSKSASIQLMTILQENDPQKSLNIYLKKLQAKQVDLEKIKIFPLTKGGRKMYGVLYGEFSSLNMAYREIKTLPDVLKANKPFPRTVKGLNDEISGR